MHVVAPAANPSWRAAGFVGMVSQHAEHLFTNIRILKIRPSLFCAEDDVQPNASQGLRHGVFSRYTATFIFGSKAPQSSNPDTDVHLRAEGPAFSQPRATPWVAGFNATFVSARRANRSPRPRANCWPVGPTTPNPDPTFPRALPWAGRTSAPSGRRRLYASLLSQHSSSLQPLCR
jgi:hypothetical protein